MYESAAAPTSPFPRSPYSKRRFAIVRRLSVGHFQAGNAQRPDVHAPVVLRAADQLGRHPERRADHRLPTILLLGKSDREAEIAELDLALGVDQHVVRFDVAVQLVVAMQVRQRLQDVPTHVRDVLLLEVDVLAENLRQTARVHELHRDPEAVVPQKTVAKTHQVRVVAQTLHRQLVLQVLQVRRGRNFQRYALARCGARSFIATSHTHRSRVHYARGAFADSLIYSVVEFEGIFHANEGG